MNVEDYAREDATGLARLIRSREISAKEAVEAAHEAIRLVEPEINACVAPPWDEPLACDLEGPFAGAPFALKDLICHAAGVPSWWGSRSTGPGGIVRDFDTALMTRFRRAGLAAVVATATPEMGYGGNTEPVVNGSTRNPWDPQRSVGGSSGGSAALVAAGGVPVAHANDAGGSIRIPSSFNGTVGLKPSRGLVSLGPGFAEGVSGLASEFVVTRSVRDAAAILDQVAGWEPGDRYRVASPPRPYLEELESVRSLRIALHTRSWFGSPVDPEVGEAVVRVARTLEGLGHRVELAAPVFDAEAFLAAERCFWFQFAADSVEAASRLSGLEPSADRLEASTRAAWQAGLRASARDYASALATQNAVSRAFGAFFRDHDVLLTPTTNTTALPLGFLDHDDARVSADEWCTRFHGCFSFTPPFNLTGLPAISLPLGESSRGMPIGVQLAADMCQESILIGASAELERAMPWAGRRPRIHAARGARSRE